MVWCDGKSGMISGNHRHVQTPLSWGACLNTENKLLDKSQVVSFVEKPQLFPFFHLARYAERPMIQHRYANDF